MQYNLNSPLKKIFARRHSSLIILAFLFAIAISTLIGCGSAGDNAKQSDNNTQTETPAADTAEKTLSDNSSKQNDDLQRVVIDTNLGKITVELDAKNAGLTVANFLRYVDEGYYNETIFHEVNKGYAILGGGYTEDMKAKNAYTPVRNEAHNGLKNLRGTIAMVRKPDVIDSATSQFLFNLADNPGLDHKDASSAETYGYCVFGKVVGGIDVLDRIGNREVHRLDIPGGEPFQNVPVEPVTINSIKRD